jgi:peptide/nickel transport system substrate-binding protein
MVDYPIMTTIHIHKRRKTMKKSGFKIFSFLIILGVLLTACAPAAVATTAPETAATTAPAVTEAATVAATEAPSAAATEAQTAAVSTIKRGGTLKYSRTILLLEVDPKNTDASGDVFIMNQILEPLIRFDVNQNKYVGVVADKWTISPDGLEYDFHIRDGIKFNNGTPVTADDVKFTFELAQKNGVWTQLQSTVKDITAVDAQDVKITLNTPTAPFIANVANYSVWIISKSAYEAAPDPTTFYKHVVSTGPFMWKDLVVGDHATLVRNPYYWRLGEDGKPLPYLDEIDFTQVPEDTTRILQVQSGSLDGTDSITWSQVNKLKTDPVGDIKTWDSLQTYYIFMNHQRPPFDDQNVRLALNYAIDRQAMVDTVLSGYGVPAYSFVPEKDPCKDPTVYYPYDLAKAKELVAASKYPNGYTGAVISVPQGRVIGIDDATMVADFWSKIGFNFKIEQVEGGILSARADKTDEDAISGYQWTSDSFDLDQQMRWFIITPTFYGNYVNKDSQKLVNDAAVEVDPVKRCDMYIQVQKNFAADGANAPLFHTFYNTFFAKYVKGYTFDPTQYEDFGVIWMNK